MGLVLQFPRPSGANETNEEIVSLLESLLEKARVGDVQSLVFVAAGVDGHPECGMALDRGHATAIIGTMRVAERQLIDALDATENSSAD